MLFEYQKSDQTLLKLFTNTYKRQKFFKYPPIFTWEKPKCAKSQVWLKLPIRSQLCSRQLCVYNYDENVKTYNCQYCNKINLENMYVDLRLASILTKALQYINTHYNNTKRLADLCKYTTVKTNQLGSLRIIIKLNNIQKIIEQNEFKDKSLMNTNEDPYQTKQQIARSYRNQCQNYLENKKSLNKLTKKLQNEINSIVNSISSSSIINQIIDTNIYNRIIYKNSFLFGFSKGEIFICNGPKIQDKVIVGVEEDFKSFYGASWFSSTNNNVYTIYSVGGSSNQKTYSKGLLSFKMDLDKFIFKALIKQNQLLDLFNTAVVFIKQKNIAYAFGGINTHDLKPRQSIIQINLNSNTVSKIGNLKNIRFNHSAIRYEKFIYIIGGIGGINNQVKEQLDIQKPISSFTFQHIQKNIQIFNIQTKQIIQNLTTIKLPDQRRLFYRSVPVMAFSNKTKYIVLFGENRGNNLQEKKSIALDLKELTWSEYGDNSLAIRFQIGQDKIVSSTMNIIDFEGWQTENSTKFLHISSDGSKKSQIIFTTQGAQDTYRWKF